MKNYISMQANLLPAKTNDCDNNRIYNTKEFHFSPAQPLERAEEYTVCIKFNDGLPTSFSLSANGIKAHTSVGYTCCNTQRERTAAFVVKLNEEQLGDGILDVTLTGIKEVISIEICAGADDSALEKARTDRVKPGEAKSLVEITNPIQLIVNLGADANTREELPLALERIRENAPLYVALGFNGFESYVKWNFIEYDEGHFDWSYYDSVVDLCYEYGLKWFPLIIGGSAYAIPEWYREKEGFTGFRCLEHSEENNVPTIFNEHQTPYIVRYLHEFGKHYEGSEKVFGIRLGPSGNYGESQYPATGNWGYKGLKEHMHIGWWAGDKDASPKFAARIKEKYNGNIDVLNQKWETSYSDFSEIETFIPNTVSNLRRRKDFVDWYMDEMTDWCNRWGVWVREELKSHDIYQSSGGWGFCELGTDFTDQTKGMVPINGGIRATNEDESYELNFAITRMLSSAARFYNVPFGSEPAGYGTCRSVINRLFNIVVNNGQHLFYYGGNFLRSDNIASDWLRSANALNLRSEPLIDVAVLYPDTLAKLSDSSIRWLDGSSFFSQVFPLRRKLDYDFCSERMVLDGALERYKVLVFLSRNHDGDYIEADALNKIDEWIRNGGTAIYPLLHSNARKGPYTVEGDNSVFNRWQNGDTGKGKVIFIHTLREPLDDYIDDIAQTLKEFDFLNPLTRKMLRTEKPRGVYLSALKSGKLVAYNDKDFPVEIVCDGKAITLEPLSVSFI